MAAESNVNHPVLTSSQCLGRICTCRCGQRAWVLQQIPAPASFGFQVGNNAKHCAEPAAKRHTQKNKQERKNKVQFKWRWVGGLELNQTQLETCLSCSKDNAIQKANLTPGELHSCFLVEAFPPASFLVGSIGVVCNHPLPTCLPKSAWRDLGDLGSSCQSYQYQTWTNSLSQCWGHWTTKETLFRNP